MCLCIIINHFKLQNVHGVCFSVGLSLINKERWKHHHILWVSDTGTHYMQFSYRFIIEDIQTMKTKA